METTTIENKNDNESDSSGGITTRNTAVATADENVIEIEPTGVIGKTTQSDTSYTTTINEQPISFSPFESSTPSIVENEDTTTTKDEIESNPIIPIVSAAAEETTVAEDASASPSAPSVIKNDESHNINAIIDDTHVPTMTAAPPPTDSYPNDTIHDNDDGVSFDASSVCSSNTSVTASSFNNNTNNQISIEIPCTEPVTTTTTTTTADIATDPSPTVNLMTNHEVNNDLIPSPTTACTNDYDVTTNHTIDNSTNTNDNNNVNNKNDKDDALGLAVTITNDTVISPSSTDVDTDTNAVEKPSSSEPSIIQESNLITTTTTAEIQNEVIDTNDVSNEEDTTSSPIKTNEVSIDETEKQMEESNNDDHDIGKNETMILQNTKNDKDRNNLDDFGDFGEAVDPIPTTTTTTTVENNVDLTETTFETPTMTTTPVEEFNVDHVSSEPTKEIVVEVPFAEKELNSNANDDDNDDDFGDFNQSTLTHPQIDTNNEDEKSKDEEMNVKLSIEKQDDDLVASSTTIAKDDAVDDQNDEHNFGDFGDFGDVTVEAEQGKEANEVQCNGDADSSIVVEENVEKHTNEDSTKDEICVDELDEAKQVDDDKTDDPGEDTDGNGEDEFGDFGDFGGADEEPVEKEGEKSTTVSNNIDGEKPTEESSSEDQIKDGDEDEDEFGDFGDFGDFEEPDEEPDEEPTTVEKDIVSNDTKSGNQDQIQDDDNDDDEFGDFGDGMEDTQNEQDTPKAADNDNTHSPCGGNDNQDNANKEEEDDDDEDDFGDFGDFEDGENTVEETTAVSSTSIFQQIFHPYYCKSQADTSSSEEDQDKNVEIMSLRNLLMKMSSDDAPKDHEIIEENLTKELFDHTNTMEIQSTVIVNAVQFFDCITTSLSEQNVQASFTEDKCRYVPDVVPIDLPPVESAIIERAYSNTQSEVLNETNDEETNKDETANMNVVDAAEETDNDIQPTIVKIPEKESDNVPAEKEDEAINSSVNDKDIDNDFSDFQKIEKEVDDGENHDVDEDFGDFQTTDNEFSDFEAVDYPSHEASTSNDSEIQSNSQEEMKGDEFDSANNQFNSDSMEQENPTSSNSVPFGAFNDQKVAVSQGVSMNGSDFDDFRDFHNVSPNMNPTDQNIVEQPTVIQANEGMGFFGSINLNPGNANDQNNFSNPVKPIDDNTTGYHDAFGNDLNLSSGDTKGEEGAQFRPGLSLDGANQMHSTVETMNDDKMINSLHDAAPSNLAENGTVENSSDFNQDANDDDDDDDDFGDFHDSTPVVSNEEGTERNEAIPNTDTFGPIEPTVDSNEGIDFPDTFNALPSADDHATGESKEVHQDISLSIFDSHLDSNDNSEKPAMDDSNVLQPPLSFNNFSNSSAVTLESNEEVGVESSSNPAGTTQQEQVPALGFDTSNFTNSAMEGFGSMYNMTIPTAQDNHVMSSQDKNRAMDAFDVLQPGAIENYVSPLEESGFANPSTEAAVSSSVPKNNDAVTDSANELNEDTSTGFIPVVADNETKVDGQSDDDNDDDFGAFHDSNVEKEQNQESSDQFVSGQPIPLMEPSFVPSMEPPAIPPMSPPTIPEITTANLYSQENSTLAPAVFDMHATTPPVAMPTDLQPPPVPVELPPAIPSTLQSKQFEDNVDTPLDPFPSLDAKESEDTFGDFHESSAAVKPEETIFANTTMSNNVEFQMNSMTPPSTFSAPNNILSNQAMEMNHVQNQTNELANTMEIQGTISSDDEDFGDFQTVPHTSISSPAPQNNAVSSNMMNMMSFDPNNTMASSNSMMTANNGLTNTDLGMTASGNMMNTNISSNNDTFNTNVNGMKMNLNSTFNMDQFNSNNMVNGTNSNVMNANNTEKNAISDAFSIFD